MLLRRAARLAGRPKLGTTAALLGRLVRDGDLGSVCRVARLTWSGRVGTVPSAALHRGGRRGHVPGDVPGARPEGRPSAEVRVRRSAEPRRRGRRRRPTPDRPGCFAGYPLLSQTEVSAMTAARLAIVSPVVLLLVPRPLLGLRS